MEWPSTDIDSDEFRHILLSKLEIREKVIDSSELPMAIVVDVLRLLTFDVAEHCPDDVLFQSITEAGGDWWKSGPQGGQISRITAIATGRAVRDTDFESEVRRELRAYVARVISILRRV